MNAEWVYPKASARRLNVFGSLAARHALWWQTALALFCLMALCLLLSLFDDRTLNGVSVWAKPFKFSLSLAVYFATLAWFAPLLPNGYLEARAGRWITVIPVVCAVFEMAYIVLQAGRGEASHFNLTTPLYSMMYGLMGLGAVMLVSICLWIGVVILREHGTSDPYALAVGVGLIMTFALGGGFGGYMSQHLSHWVGGTPSDVNGVWLVQWSRDGGDLRVAHFFGMHSMQVLPAIGALARSLSSRLATATVIGAAVAYAVATTLTFVQALNGAPFI